MITVPTFEQLEELRETGRKVGYNGIYIYLRYKNSGMTMMQWTRWGESIWNMVHKWHTLEHRKTTIGDVLFQQFQRLHGGMHPATPERISHLQSAQC